MIRFEWFARADDDVYIRGSHLSALLRSIDSNLPHYIGQPGQGRSEDIGQLNLAYDDNFCMGGTAYIISRETLRRIGPYISTCLRNLFSIHDDVEIGRCIHKFAGISCTWAFEVGLCPLNKVDLSTLHFKCSKNLWV